MNSKDFRKKDGDFILQLTSICTYRDYKNDGMIFLWNNFIILAITD